MYDLILGAGSVSTAGIFAVISFTARLASGISVVDLYGVGVTNANSYVPVTVTNGSVILRNYTLNIALDGQGSVTKNPNQVSYAYGTSVQSTAPADFGWAFSSWNGDITGNQNPKTVTMNGNKVVTALFIDAMAP